MSHISNEIKAVDNDFFSAITSLHKGNPAFDCGPPQIQLFLEKAIKEATGVTKLFTPMLIDMRRKEEQSYGGMDPYYVHLMSLLHAKEYPDLPVPSVLQFKVEETIRYCAGVTKDLSPAVRIMLGKPEPEDYSTVIGSLNNRPLEEVRTTTHGFEESKTSSSDNELELDLFNDDLMCVICNGMNVGARNQLLECSDCHSLYHQECHRPPVTLMDTEGNWTCQKCQDAPKRLKKSTPSSSPSDAATTSPVTTKAALKNSPPHSQHVPTSNGSTSAPSNYKAPGGNSMTCVASITKSSTTSSKPSSGKTSSVSNSSGKSSVTHNIISADKRLQIMKKKAAKLHEQRMQLPR